MTDEQLITMLYESSPGDLSATQLKVLRTRMLASASVKRAVAHRVRLEQALTETLDTPHLKTAAIVAACTAAAVAVPIAGGMLAWFKGWSLTVWSGIAAVTVSIPIVVVMIAKDPPLPDRQGPIAAPKPSIAIVDSPALPPDENVLPVETSPSDRLPPGWVPYSGATEPGDPSVTDGGAAAVDSGQR